MIKWIKNILGITIIFFLLWYLIQHWEDLQHLLKLSLADLFFIYLISLLGTLNTAYITSRLLLAFDVKTRFWDMVLLQNAASLLNYVPMKFGTIFRANYLKRHYGLSYTKFSVFFVYLTLLMIATASAVGLLVLIFIYDIMKYETRVLAVTFALLLIGSFAFAFIPLPALSKTNKIGIIAGNFAAARRQVIASNRVLITCMFLYFINFVLFSVRLGIIYHSMGQNIHPAGCLVLGALGYITLILSLTPGALGIRELVLSSGGIALGIPFKVGVLASMVDRAIILSLVFTLGSACVIRLWRKTPADFKIDKQSSLPEKQD